MVVEDGIKIYCNYYYEDNKTPAHVYPYPKCNRGFFGNSIWCGFCIEDRGIRYPECVKDGLAECIREGLETLSMTYFGKSSCDDTCEYYEYCKKITEQR